MTTATATNTPHYTANFPGYANYVLPYGRDFAKWNPMEPAAHAFGPNYMRSRYALVLKRIDKPGKALANRIIVGYGTIDDNWKIGNVWNIRHDQTNAFLGQYEVVGEVTYTDDAEVATATGVTDIKLATATFK